MDYGYAPAVEMEYGGYVEPPSHLKKSSKAPITGLPAEQRAVPDYDYSLFRYSGVAVPFLLLILASAAVLQALTWWQGPWGFERGVNGANNGIPMGLKINDLQGDAGVKNVVRNIRIAAFVIGLVAVIIAVFAIRSELRPGALKGLLLFAALLAFAVFVIEAIAFALSIDDITDAFTCQPLLYPGTPRYDGTYEVWCEPRLALEVATTIADAAYFLIAFLLFWALVFTTLKRNWAWGPGKVAVQKSPMKPRVTYPPPSPFTHIHETRRLMVWVLLIAFLAALIWDFTLTILLHQERVTARFTALTGPNRNEVYEQGWSQRNNAFRLAFTFLTMAFVFVQLLNLATWKRRWVAYTLGLLMFLAGAAGFVVFALDVQDINDADDLGCPEPASLIIRLSMPAGQGHQDEIYTLTDKPLGCPQWEFAAVAFLDFWLAFILVVYSFIEFFVRSNFSWGSFYFYADSEWLRNHSLFVESTDREAYDWKRFTMETGRDYYYSPTLGVSTITRPRNYIEPDAPLF